MDIENNGSQSEAQDVHEQIAAIEAQADMLARKNEVPAGIAKQRQDAVKFHEIEAKERNEKLSIKKPRQLKMNKWVLIGLAAVLVLLAAAWFVPASRYGFLNMVGARGELKISSVQAAAEGSKSQPKIKNFTVDIDGQSYDSGDSNEVVIGGQKYGAHNVVVSKQGYGSSSHNVTLDYDPLFGLFGQLQTASIRSELVAKGLPLTFLAKDWTSLTPLTKGDFTYGDITARPDSEGKVNLIVPPNSPEKVEVKANLPEGYLDKTFEVELNKQDQEVAFVPSARHYFVSKRSGVYSIYSSYIDGSDLKELVKGTNQETSSLQFAVSPSGKYGVMASTRDGRRDSNGDLTQRLYWVNLSSGKLEELDTARYFTLHDWSGDTIAYSYAYQDEETKEYRQRLRSVDATTQNRYELGSTTGFFGRVNVSQGMVVFTKQEGYQKPGFEKEQTVHMVGIKGEDSRELATNIGEFRQLGFERFAYQTPDKKWNEVNVNTSQIKPIDSPNEQGTVYISTENVDKERVFINFVDGKRILMLQKSDDKSSNELVAQAGLTGPIRFMNATTIIYRVVTPNETADYAVSTLGGEPRKITDVTASSYATPVFFQYY